MTLVDDVRELKQEVKDERQENKEWREKWAGRQWALMGVVLMFTLGAIGDLLLLISQQ